MFLLQAGYGGAGIKELCFAHFKLHRVTLGSYGCIVRS